MAEMLSYLGSKSSEYVWRTQREIQFADENYAREVMQLFSVGLVKLNIDGTVTLDTSGNPIATYSNDDITGEIICYFILDSFLESELEYLISYYAQLNMSNCAKRVCASLDRYDLPFSF
jgi:hypothetical protein